jgi:succinate dehydrogenase / fumarate reductase, iron-sulfur subunit
MRMSATPAAGSSSTPAAAAWVLIRIKRRDAPGKAPRWEEFSVPRRPDMNLISCLRWIAAHPIQADGKPTTPPAWEADCLEETCGACAMLVNGKVRQACSAMVDTLADDDEAIVLEPLNKFPVVRDLVVDRGRFFEDLKRVKAWVPIDGSYDIGPGPATSQALNEKRYPLSQCIGCGCCMEACPQYTATNKFVGAAVISLARLYNDHPTGAELKQERLDALMAEGGVHDCAKSGNCVEVCPKRIPLMESIAAVGRQATVYAVKRFFTG